MKREEKSLNWKKKIQYFIPKITIYKAKWDRAGKKLHKWKEK